MTFKDLVNEAPMSDRMYKELIKSLKMNGIDYSVGKKSFIATAQPQTIIGDYMISTAGIFHDQYTVFKNDKELDSFTNIDKMLDFMGL